MLHKNTVWEMADILRVVFWEMVDNFEYGNFENFKTPNRSLCWELSVRL